VTPRRTIVLLLGTSAVALAAAAGPSAGAPGATAACKPGLKLEGPARVRTFCGPAQATVKVGSRTWRFSGGTCFKSPNSFLLGIGKYTLTTGSPRYRAFWVSIPALRDATYRSALVQWQVPGTNYVFETIAVRLSGQRSRGTFTGKVAGVGAGSGSFACK
jgi:hypothetical protein